MYALIGDKLPELTVVSIGHRSSLTRLHERFLSLVATETGAHRLVETEAPALQPA